MYLSLFDTTRPEQNGWYFAGNIFKCIILNEKFVIMVKFPWSPVDNKSALVRVMACHLLSTKPLPEPMFKMPDAKWYH